MTRSLRNVSVWFGLMGAVSAAAQNADTSAAAGASDGGSLLEGVVTARRYSEDLQNVPIGVTALNASTLETQAVTNLEDLNRPANTSLFETSWPIVLYGLGAGYDFGNPPIGPANSYIRGVSQIGFYGPPRTYSATVTYHF